MRRLIVVFGYKSMIWSRRFDDMKALHIHGRTNIWRVWYIQRCFHQKLERVSRRYIMARFAYPIENIR